MTKIILGLLSLVFILNAEDVYATFSVEPQRKAMLAFDASGITALVNYEIGSYVKKGKVLASLENSDMKASLDTAKTTFKFAKKDYDRQVKVKNLIDAGKFDTYAFKYENAKNQVKFAQAKYNKTLLRAPFDGVIYDKNIELGDTVSGLMLRTVFKIQSKTSRKLILGFDQRYHKVVKIGQTFTYSVDGDTKKYTGVISKIYPFANNKNRKIIAEVKAKDFIVGLFGDGYIQIPSPKSKVD